LVAYLRVCPKNIFGQFIAFSSQSEGHRVRPP
jgi:hypothetical protein